MCDKIDAILYNTVIKNPNSYELLSKVNAMNFDITQDCSCCKYNDYSHCHMNSLPIKGAPKSCRKNRVLFELVVYDKKGKTVEPAEQDNAAIVNSIDFVPEECIVDGDMWIMYKVKVTLL